MEAEILQIEKGVDGLVRAYVKFSFSDAKTKDVVNPEWIAVTSNNEDDFKRTLQGRMSAIQDMFTFADSLPVGMYDTTIIDDVPTEAEQEKDTYFDLLNKWNMVQNDIKANLIAADDEKVVKLATDLKAAYKPEYSGLDSGQ